MMCSGCGRDRPDTDNFCASCGAPLYRDSDVEESPLPTSWEYRDLEIPLNFTSVQLNEAQQTERIVLEQVRRAEREGWHADTPTSWRQLLEGGQIKRRYHRSGLGTAFYRCESVTLRFKRPI